MKKLFKCKRGVSIVEFVTVIAVMLILVAVAAPLYRGVRESARETAFDATVRGLHMAGQMCLTENPDANVIWSAEGGREAGVMSAPHEGWMLYYQEFPVNPLETGDFVVEISGGVVSVSPGR